jgi:hypothetical protein
MYCALSAISGLFDDGGSNTVLVWSTTIPDDVLTAPRKHGMSWRGSVSLNSTAQHGTAPLALFMMRVSSAMPVT